MHAQVSLRKGVVAMQDTLNVSGQPHSVFQKNPTTRVTRHIQAANLENICRNRFLSFQRNKTLNPENYHETVRSEDLKSMHRTLLDIAMFWETVDNARRELILSMAEQVKIELTILEGRNHCPVLRP